MLLHERIERQPAHKGNLGLLQLPTCLLPAGEPIVEQVQAHLPLLLLLHPPVERSFFAQPEAVKEGTTNQ